MRTLGYGRAFRSALLAARVHHRSIPVRGPGNDPGGSGIRKRILDAANAVSNRLAQIEAGEEPIVFVELDTRQDAGCTVSLEWDRGTDDTRIVLSDRRTACVVAFPVPGELAGDAFRHPFRYAP